MKIKVNQKMSEFPDGSLPKDIAEKLHLTAPEQAIAVSVNGCLSDFTTPLKEGDELIFWNFDDPQGKEVFWHTSAHVLAQAILRLWPEAQPTIGPPIEHGFYYDFGNLTISDEDFGKIEKEDRGHLKRKLQDGDGSNLQRQRRGAGSFCQKSLQMRADRQLCRRRPYRPIAKGSFSIFAAAPIWRL